MNVNDSFQELLDQIHRELLKPRGWKKQGNNFRLVHDDGLGQIINFQRSRWNTAESCGFFINYGVYMEADPTLKNKTFKEYHCQLRRRAAHEGDIFTIDGHDLSAVEKDAAAAVRSALAFFDLIGTKERFVKMLLSGEAQKYSAAPVLHYHTCKLLCGMGYYREVQEIIKDRGGPYFEELKEQIGQKINR